MMELKVWVEGIQRVVCGVTDTTTCRDVVYALAHATGRTGRFTLVERWRTNERLLAPQERPVKVLTKWGEYSTDVQFTLLRSPLEKSPSGRRVARHRAGAAPRPVSPQAALGADGASSTTVLSPELQRRPPAGSGGAELRLADSCGPGRGSVAVGVVRGVPQRRSPPSRQTPSSDKPPAAAAQSHPAVPALNESVSSAASFSSSQEGGGPHTRFDTPPPYRDPPRPGRGGIRAHPPPYRQPPALTPPHADTSSHQQPSHKQRVMSPPLPASAMEPRTNGQWRVPVSGIGGVSPSPVISSPAAAVSDALLNNNEYRQLLAVVSSQKQRLSSLKSDIDKSDAETVYVEQVQRENDTQMAALQMETDRLEAVLSERQSELASAEDNERALRREMSENERLQTEITAVREKMRQCEQRLLDYHSQLGDLSSAVPEERRLADGEEAAARDELLQLSRRVTQLQESQQLVAEQRAAVELELGRLTGQMDERQLRVRELHDELKQLNMQSLALSESGGGPAAVEGSARPGGGVSRQLKGSARQLETAVPTSTNPHGVWV